MRPVPFNRALSGLPGLIAASQRARFAGAVPALFTVAEATRRETYLAELARGLRHA